MDLVEQLLKRGQPLGHYKLTRLLGRGGFADVYLGEHIHLNTQVAVKILHTRLAEEDIQAFKREAQMVARLMHPHIVRVLDFGVEEAMPYLVMDYAPDGTLRQAFKKGQRIPLPTIVPLIKQAAEALFYAHNQRVIHRDIKPENMLLGRNREMLLSDFGIALVQQSSRLQSTQNIAGTIAYMAPEQISAHPRPASDQYSLGIVAYEWLCGSRPFQGSYTEIAIKHSMVPPPPLRSYLPELAPAVEQVIMRALSKDPDQRFPDVRGFAQALEQAAQQPGTFSSSSSTFVGAQFPVQPSAPLAGSQLTPPSAPLAGQQPLPSTLTPPPSGVTGQSSVSTSPAVYPPPPPGQSPSPYFQPAQQQPPSPYAYLPLAQSQYSGNSSLTPPIYAQTGDPAFQQQRQKGQRSTRRAFLIAGGTLGLILAGGATATVVLLQHNPLQQAFNAIQQHTNTAGASVELTYSQFEDLVWIVRWSADGKLIAAGCFDGTMQIWTADKGETKLTVRSSVQPRQSDDYPWSIAWTPRSGQKVAVSFVDGTIQVLDMSTGHKMATPPLTTPPLPVPVLTWSPDERYLAIGGGNGHVSIYEYVSDAWKLVYTYQEHTDSIDVLAWSPDGALLASGSSDTTVRVWEPLTGKTKLIYSGHTDQIRSLSWSPDSTRFISTSKDQSAKVCRINTNTTLYTYPAPGGAPLGEATWSHNGKTIAIYGGDATIYLLDAETGQEKGNFSSGVVYSLAWSPDDSRLATGSYDKQVQIWHIG